MSTPASDKNEPGKTKRMSAVNMDQTISSKLPHVNRGSVENPSVTTPPPVFPSPEPEPKTPRLKSAPIPTSSEPAPRYRFPHLKLLPAFWTVASVMSMVVNIILIIVLLVMLQIYKSVQALQPVQRLQSVEVLQEDPRTMLSSVLGGLHSNFVKMDQATITSTIPVDANIQLDMIVPVQTTTRITLAESVIIPNAHVRINTGGLNIDANAVVTLPANTPLMVNLDFMLPVQSSVPVHLDVPVKIPLNQTELHEPFVGLQKVVEPWYCLLEPDATLNSLPICSGTNPVTDPTLIDPALRNPNPAGTVIP